jgi:hypothetical protein
LAAAAAFCLPASDFAFGAFFVPGTPVAEKAKEERRGSQQPPHAAKPWRKREIGRDALSPTPTCIVIEIPRPPRRTPVRMLAPFPRPVHLGDPVRVGKYATNGELKSHA